MSIEAMKQALEALVANRRTHYYCEDTWYSCPRHEEGCANDAEGDECNCGADKANEQIDNAITALRAAIEQAERQQTHSEECWKWHHECAVAKINQLQAGIETLHAMYEQACQQRDYLMDQQRAQIEAMRGRVQ